ncbi:putative universal stress protein [Nocardia nova SH22a]|uniref:Putative universal stress protein n=1 Tax=Nocardia nova SH22a TaxID=1415166 RepID=W5TG37_9NOCA|nr:universal stress protein [Nocardia nova]AHH18315.1 putative universal stress protein [Nocardia nova SH22a]
MTDETSPDEGVRPIVVATDGSAVSCHAVAWAAVDAAAHGCPLHVLASVAFQGAYGPVPYVTAEAVAQMQDDGDRVVDEAVRIAEQATAPGAVEISREVSFDPIIPCLIARSRNARTVVVGSRGRGTLRRALLGSVSSAIIHHAHCPVAVVRATSNTDPVGARMPVLVGADGSADSARALAIAFEEAELRGVGLIAVRCWSDSEEDELLTSAWDRVRDKEQALLEEELAGYRERHPGVTVRSAVFRAEPARTLLAESDHAQLVVVGSRGRGGFTGMLLGSTSAAMAQSVDCPIIIARGPASDGHRAEP